MLTNPNFLSHSDSDSEFDDSISLTSYDSETFSQLDAEREARNQELQKQAIADKIRIAQLESALAAQNLGADKAPNSPSDPLVLAAIQRAEAAERQLAEERHIRETAEKTASDAREKLARIEAQQAQETLHQQALLLQQQAAATQQTTVQQITAKPRLSVQERQNILKGKR